MKLIANFYKKNISAMNFTFFKYVEVVLNGILMLILAKLIGPSEMGKSISSLLYITYSAYLTLGLNSVIVKNFKKIESKSQQISFLTINFQLLLFLSSLNFIITFFIFSKDVFFLVSIISIGYVFRSFFSAYFRVVDKTYVLNINNILLSVLLILGTYLYVNLWIEYLFVWSIVILITTIVYFIFDYKLFSIIIKNSLRIQNNIKLKHNVIEGLKLSSLAILSTIYLSADRFIINGMNLSNELKGSYQFADNFSSAVFIGFSALIFFYTPNWIHKVRNNKFYSEELFKIVNFSVFVIPIVSSLFFTISYLLENYWFTEYINLSKFVFVTTFLKLLILLSGIESLIFIALNKELKYFKINLFTICLVVFTFLYFKFFDHSQTEISVIPIILSLIVIILLFVQRIYLKKIFKL